MNFAKRVQVGRLVANKGAVVEVTTHSTIAEVARVLNQYHFLSVPVWDPDNKRYIAFVDVLDLLNHTALVFDLKHHVEKIEDFDKKAFAYGTVEDLLREEDHKRIHVFGEDARLENVMKVLCESDPRVLVAQVSVRTVWGRVHLWKKLEYKMLSQTDVVRWLMENKQEVGDCFHVQIREIPGIRDKRRLLTCTLQESALEAMMKMVENELEALCVVDQGGKIVEVISASDLRGLSVIKLRYLLLPVKDFLFFMTGKRARPVIKCKEEEALPAVIQRMLSARVHRAFVTDSEDKPTGILELRDIIQVALAISMTCGCATPSLPHQNATAPCIPTSLQQEEREKPPTRLRRASLIPGLSPSEVRSSRRFSLLPRKSVDKSTGTTAARSKEVAPGSTGSGIMENRRWRGHLSWESPVDTPTAANLAREVESTLNMNEEKTEEEVVIPMGKQEEAE